MTHHDTHRFTFYFPQAKVLSSAEVASLPADKRKAAETSGREGVWLEVHCPEGSCIGKDGKITLQAAGISGKSDKGLWLNVFCPEDSCLWKGGSELA
jgi:hypothetical protein